MGYSEKLYILPKDEYNEYKKLTENEIKKDYESVEDFLYSNIKSNNEFIHEFGNSQVMSVKLNNFFDDDNIKFNDYRVEVVTKEQLKNIIENVKSEIITVIKNQIKNIKELNSSSESERITAEENIEIYFRRELAEWANIMDINYSEKQYPLVDSWMKNYDVFNLIYIYKIFDFENNVLILYGS